MSDQTIDGAGDEFKDLAEKMPDANVTPAHGIAAIALSMAMKYCAINTVQDGVLYQQYKLEGRNMRNNSLDEVFEMAILIERHLLGASDRIAKIVVDALSIEVEDDQPTEADAASSDRPEA